MNNQLIELLYLKGMSREALIKYIKCNKYQTFALVCQKGHLEFAKFLLEQGFVEEQIKVWDYGPFKIACRNGHLEVVKFLLEQGFVKAQIGAENYGAFKLACYNGHLEVVKLLLKQGFVKQQIKGLRKWEQSKFKIRYKDLVEKGIVNA